MKSILFLSSAAFGSSLRENVLKSDPRSWSCFFDCVGTYFRGDVYCSYTWEFESEDYYRCLEPFKEELDQCVAGLRDFVTLFKDLIKLSWWLLDAGTVLGKMHASSLGRRANLRRRICKWRFEWTRISQMLGRSFGKIYYTSLIFIFFRWKLQNAWATAILWIHDFFE